MIFLMVYIKKMNHISLPKTIHFSVMKLLVN